MRPGPGPPQSWVPRLWRARGLAAPSRPCCVGSADRSRPSTSAMLLLVAVSSARSWCRGRRIGSPARRSATSAGSPAATAARRRAPAVDRQALERAARDLGGCARDARPGRGRGFFRASTPTSPPRSPRSGRSWSATPTARRSGCATPPTRRRSGRDRPPARRRRLRGRRAPAQAARARRPRPPLPPLRPGGRRPRGRGVRRPRERAPRRGRGPGHEQRPRQLQRRRRRAGAAPGVAVRPRSGGDHPVARLRHAGGRERAHRGERSPAPRRCRSSWKASARSAPSACTGR